MADTFEFKNLVGTVKGMTAILDNVECDDDSVEVTGVGWFTYANNPATTIYVNGNNYIGFGVDEEQLKICNDDGEIYYVYRQDGTLDTGEKFLKIRVEGFTDYDIDYQDDRSALKYELFILNNQTIKLLLLQLPSDSNYLGTSSISDGTNTADLPITSETKAPFLIEVKNAGVSQEVTGTAINFTKIEVTKLPNKIEYYQKEPFDSTGIVVTGTSDIGNFEINGYTLSGFDNNSAGAKTITVSYDTLTTTFDVNVSDIAITGIDYTCPESELKHHLESAPNFNNFTFYKTLSNNQRVELTQTERNALIFSESVNSWSPGNYTETVTWGGFEANIPIEIMQPTEMTVDEYTYAPQPCFVGDSASAVIHKISVTYEDGTDVIDNPNGMSSDKIDTTTAGTKEIAVSFHKAVSTNISIPVLSLDNYEEYIGTPNKNDVLAKYDKNTNTLIISGTGNFTSLTYRKELFVDMVRKIKFDGNLPEIPIGFSSSMPNIENVIFCDSIIKINSGNFSPYLGEEVILPPKIQYIDGGVFNECKNLKNINLPETLSYMPWSFGAYTLENIIAGGENVKIGNGGIKIPACKNLVIRGGTIEKDGINFTKTETLTLKGKVKFSGSGQSYGGSQLKSIILEDGITEIPDNCFGSCGSVSELTLANTIKTIGQYNFNNMKITSLELPASLVSISSNSFSDLSVLTEIIFHEGLERIEGGAFYNCQHLDSVVFPESLSILQGGFGNGIDNVEIGGAGKTISSSGIKIPTCKNLIIRGGTIDGNGGTSSLLQLESLTLKGTVEFSNDSQFTPAYTLKTVILESGIKEIPSSCFSGCRITKIVIPESVKSIGDSAFRFTLLENVTIPDGVETIGAGAFSGAKIANIVIPKSVTSIGNNAFSSPVSTNVSLNKKTNEITGSPWGASGTITWLIRATRLEVTHMPAKIRYFVGEAFDSTGLIITAYYNDNTSEQVTGYTLSSPDMNAYGNKTVTVTFDEKTVDFSILVVDISGIEIKTPPTKQEYLVGDALDSTGLTVLVKYTDGTSGTITSGFTVSELDSSSIGEKEITVAYKNHTATFKVLVYELQGIRITHYPEKTYYRVGETFDPTGLVVVALRTDNTEKEITDYTVSGFDSSKAGTKTITVSYQTEIGGIETFIGYDEFEIKVTKDGTNPFEDNTDPISVKVHWINGEFEDLTNDNVQSNTLSLQESLCNKAYFIFGGCISNQITFKCYHPQFIGTDESTYPSGKIEVCLECKGTEIKIFTGEIATGERDVNSFVRTIVAYDYLYKLRNTDVAWWYKNNTKDKQMVFTQKQFRDALFKYLGIEQVDAKLKYDSAYVPNTANSSEMNVANILEDLCLQNNVFGWMNRDGKFEYKKLKKNCKHRGTTVSGVETFDFYESEVHLDRFKSFKATEGRVWYFNYVYTDPDPSGEVFTSGEPTAQDAYERNVFYNRNSFFVGNQDWLNYAYDANEYGDYTRTKPKYAICYGTVAEDIIKKQYYRAQGYSVEVQGNPFNMVGQTVEMTHSKPFEDGSTIQWTIHSYIMSRTLKLGITGLIDTYTANNSPYNGNNQQLGKNTPEITSTINRTRSEMPTISYAEFTDGTEPEITTIDDFSDSSGSSSTELKKAQLRCVKRIKKADYDALVAVGTDRTDTLYFTFEEG